MTQPALPDPTDAAVTDLLAHLVSADSAYPWDPTDPGAEVYWQRLDEPLGDLALEDAMAATLEAGWSRLAGQLAQQWSVNPVQEPALDSLALGGPWQDCLPTDLLQTLVATARDLVHGGESRLEQLVSCVSAILPGWDPQDLAVLARPLAYSLRDGQSPALELNLGVAHQPWEQRSPMDQARLSLAIAAQVLQALERP
ncbi:MAG: hypothetical protein VKL98_01145 [Cyanobacteriota bacterium]|nr:hypothetical protein [Cyanobacteriota bacterium]